MKDFSDARILVTGGAGFIGSHTVRALTKAGVGSVVVYDSFVTGSRDALPEDERVRVIEGDIRDFSALEQAMQNITHVVHLAAFVSVPESMKDPVTAYEVNTTGTLKILEAARSAGGLPVVYASSAAVYGNDPEVPKREDMKLLPESPYALSKIENELAARMYARILGVPSIGLRFFNVYGKGQRADSSYASVIPRWLAASAEGAAPELHGDGTQTRDFVHVTDVAAAIIAALESLPRSSGEVFNIGSGTELSLNDLWQEIARARSISIEPVRLPMRPGDIKRSVADITKAREGLSFSPQVEFSQGIAELCA